MTIDFKEKLIDESNFDKLPKAPGIYIWGFLTDGYFIPHYVGQTGNLQSRLNSHFQHLNDDKSTYKKLELDFMKEFYKSSELPAYIDYKESFSNRYNYKNDTQWFKNNPDLFCYKIHAFSGKSKVNGQTFLDIKTGGRNGTKKYLEDGNFRVLYYQLDEEFLKKYNELFDSKLDKTASEFLELLETLVKFSLKGKTYGSSISIEKMNGGLKHYFPGETIDVRSSEEPNLFDKNLNSNNLNYHDEREEFGY